MGRHSMFSLKSSGSFAHLENFLKKSKSIDYQHIMMRYGQIGVESLSKTTPVDSGQTANSWRYEIETTPMGNKRIVWYNDNVHDGAVIAILLQYGHATPSGTYVEGTDYINPAMESTFEKLAQQLWKEVTEK